MAVRTVWTALTRTTAAGESAVSRGRVAELQEYAYRGNDIFVHFSDLSLRNDLVFIAKES